LKGYPRHDGDWQPVLRLARVCYRRAVIGAHHGTAVFDPAMVPDIARVVILGLGDGNRVLNRDLDAPLIRLIRGGTAAVEEHPRHAMWLGLNGDHRHGSLNGSK
jgi:hypothetical protein